MKTSAERAPAVDRAISCQLDLLRQNLAQATYPNYPPPEQRLVLSEMETSDDGRLAVPDGPWAVKATSAPSPALQAHFEDHGIDLDSAGRPLHPWFEQMALGLGIGVVTGKGFYRHWGANYTADNIVVCDDKVLLVQRKDTGLWALPGGFVDHGETASQAARRELAEETGIKLKQSDDIIYQGPVADIRMTANAWPETTALFYQVDEPLAAKAGDDAAKAEWKPLAELPEQLFGSHKYLLELAAETIKES
jgi:ADP-ribose pyrophosphatase